MKDECDDNLAITHAILNNTKAKQLLMLFPHKSNYHVLGPERFILTGVDPVNRSEPIHRRIATAFAGRNVLCRLRRWLGCANARKGGLEMKKLMAIAAVGLALGACTPHEERVGGGALVGAATGAVIGGLATGRAGGALAGAAIGGAGGAIIGSATSPYRRGYYYDDGYYGGGCPYGYYRDYYGRLYCR
jgi:osmotically inducible lipoprotein OsmB